MKNFITIFLFLIIGFTTTAQEKENKPLRIIAIGAHPDDCDFKFGGTAALFSEMGHKVKFLTLTNGDAGHQNMGGGVLGNRRRKEANKAGKILGVEYEVLDNHDGELLPNLEVRNQVIRKIREWKADIVLGLRPNDYHPDHRNAGIIVQDAAYLVIVPNVTPDTPALKKNPVFFYMNDNFQKPYPFSRDVAVVIDKVMNKKIQALAAHESQMFEWGPWTNGVKTETIPENSEERLEWLNDKYNGRKDFNQTELNAIKTWYPSLDASRVKNAEFFELCEYGYQPKKEELAQLFPMVNRKNN